MQSRWSPEMPLITGIGSSSTRTTTLGAGPLSEPRHSLYYCVGSELCFLAGLSCLPERGLGCLPERGAAPPGKAAMSQRHPEGPVLKAGGIREGEQRCPRKPPAPSCIQPSRPWERQLARLLGPGLWLQGLSPRSWGQ